MNKFIVKKQVYYFAWHCFAPYVLLGYFISIPATCEPSWLKINQTIHRFKIDVNWLNLAFALGLLIASAIEMKGTNRQRLIKIDTMMIVPLILQWFLPFREGTIIIRIIMGILINLDIKYSNLYFRSLIFPIEDYIEKKYPEQENIKMLGFQLFMRQYIAFSIGWLFQGLMSFCYPSQDMLNKLKIYDDSVLWDLIISMPVVFIAIRLINLHLSFNYDELKICKQNEAEYFLANMFKKAYIEEVIDMYNDHQINKVESKQEIEDFKSQKIYQIILYTSGTMLLVLYSNKLKNQDININLHRFVLLFGICLSLICFYSSTTILQLAKLFHRIPYHVTYKMSILLSVIIQVAFILSNYLENYYFILIGSFLMILSNGFGLFTFTSAFNYFMDDFMGQQITQSLTLIVVILIEFAIGEKIFGIGTFVMLVLGIFSWRRVGNNIVESEEYEDDNVQLME